MPQITRHTIISRTPTEVFTLLTDPERIRPLVPGVVAVSQVRLPIAVGSSFRWDYLFLGMRFHGLWKVDELQAPLVYSAVTTGGIVSRWTYTLKPSGPSTRVTLVIDYGVPDSLLKRFAVHLIEPHTSSLAATYLENLKHYLEQQRGPERPA